MTQPIRPHGFLRTADRLARGTGAAGRPPLSDLRRATSTAYYAIFHALVRDGATVFLQNANEDELAAVIRTFTHTGVYKAALLVDKAADPKSQVQKGYRLSVMALRAAARLPGEAFTTLDPHVVRVARTFATLQAERHRADYDGTYDPVRAATIGHVDDAQVALDDTRWLWRSQHVKDPARQAAYATYATFLRIAHLQSGELRSR